MSLWSAILSSNTISGIEEAFGARDITTPAMKEAIRTGWQLYFLAEKTKAADPSLRLPVTIVNKLCKTIFSEYTLTLREEKPLLARLLRNLEKVRKKALQFTLVGGEVFLKPILSQGTLDFVLLRRDNFVPFARDVHGKITDVGTAEKTVANGRFYTFLERRRVTEDGTLTIENRLYSSVNQEVLGQQIPLSALERYRDIPPEILLPGVYNLGMVQLRTPLLNTVDGSNDGVAIYDPAKGLISNIYRSEALLDTEFENGKSLIIGSSDMITVDKHGRKSIADTLFVGVDDNIGDTGVTVYNPTLREASFLAREQSYLKAVENLIGFKRGILSDVEAAERTATEITSTAGDYNLTIQDFQSGWEEMLRELLATCRILAELYRIPLEPFDPEKDVLVEWGDGVLYDRTRVNQELLALVQASILTPERYLAWYFELPCQTPADRERIRADYMPKMEQLLQE